MIDINSSESAAVLAVQPIVRVRCSSAVDDLAAITVLGSIGVQLRELADAHFVSLSDTVFIVEQP